MDECFLDFCKAEQTHSVIPLLSQNKHILVLKSFTKMYGMAGIRLGYGLCRDDELICRMHQCGQGLAGKYRSHRRRNGCAEINGAYRSGEGLCGQ